jgi:DNA recombination protein RmuC
MGTTDKTAQDRSLQQFGIDLKERIKEVSRYVVNKDNCVDYVLLFVPSESVFEIINKNFTSIIDNSFSQQVILVSPHSFFAVVRTIQESYTHFYYEQNLKEILRHLQDLLANFERFKGEFVAVGSALDSAQKKYQQIGQTRYKEINRITTKINQYQIDQGEAPLALPTDLMEDIATIEEITE